MTKLGVFAVDRGVFDHPAFKPEPFTEREAWLWLLSEATWKPRAEVRRAAARVALTRGQLAHSLRYIAKRWGWKEPRVRRFLNRLKNDAMIDAATDAGVTVITVRNYNKYQRVSLPSDAASDAASDTQPTQHRRKKEDKEDKEYKESPSLRSGGDDKPPKRGTRLPVDWLPDADGQRFAAEKLGSIEAALEEFAKFRDHWIAQSGRKGVKTDWPATWRNWCRNAPRFNSGRAQARTAKSFHQIAAELEAAETGGEQQHGDHGETFEF